MTFDVDEVSAEMNEVQTEEIQHEETPEIDYASELEKERTERKKTEERYKSLQGQYSSFREQRGEMDSLKAQVGDLTAALRAQMIPKQEEKPLLSDGLKTLFADEAGNLEQAFARSQASVETKLQAQIAALQQQIASISDAALSAPFQYLSATDPTIASEAFSDFIRNEKDQFGDSLYDRIAAKGQQDRKAGIQALMQAKQIFASRQKPADQAVQQNVTPNLKTVAGTPPKSQSQKVDANNLRAEYRKLAASNLAEHRARRIEISVLAAVNGFEL